MERITSTLEGAVLSKADVVPSRFYYTRVEGYVFYNGNQYEVVFLQGDGTDWMTGELLVTRGTGPSPYWAAMIAWVDGRPENMFVFDQMLEVLGIEPDKPGSITAR